MKQSGILVTLSTGPNLVQFYFQGKEICFCYNEDTLTLVDVTDKNNAYIVSKSGYTTSMYTHQVGLLSAVGSLLGTLCLIWWGFAHHFAFNTGLQTALICHAMPCHMPCHAIPCHVSYHMISYHMISYDIISYDIISYHIIPYHTIPYHTIPHHMCYVICELQEYR